MMKKILFAFLAAIVLPASLSAGEVVRLTRYMGENLTGVSASFLFQVEFISSAESKAIVELPLEMENYLVFEKNANGVIKVDMNIPREVQRQLERNNRNYWNENKLVLKIYTQTIEYINLTTVAKLSATGHFTGNNVEIKADAASKLNEINLTAQSLKVRLSGAATSKINAQATSVNLRLEGAGKLTMNLTGNESLTMDIDGAGKLDLNLPENKRIDMDVSGAGNVTLRGQGGTLLIDASSAAKVYAKEFPAGHVEVTASSAANVTVHATDSLKISTSSAAKVQYTGNPAERNISNPNVREIN